MQSLQLQEDADNLALSSLNIIRIAALSINQKNSRWQSENLCFHRLSAFELLVPLVALICWAKQIRSNFDGEETNPRNW